MKKYIFLFFAVCAFSVYANAQNRTGDCTSYTSDDRSVTFYLNDSSAIQLRLCSQSTVRIWFSPDGSFQRSNPSFAVINEDLEDVGTVHVDEQNACYEIFTPKLRIRVNKSPFNLQIFDKYQKLLFSDYADKGHISNGQRKLEYKTSVVTNTSSAWEKRPASWTVAAKPTRCGTVTSLVIVPLRTRSTRVFRSL